MGGDVMNNDGSGTCTVYAQKDTMPAEQNNLKFTEPFLLAMASNNRGYTGSQFFITLEAAPALSNTQHTIIGRVMKGQDVLEVVTGMEDFRRDMPYLE